MSIVSNMTLPSHMAGFLHELGPPGGGVYSFVSRPAALLLRRPRYKNEQNGGRPVNIMHDRRVIRGNTYSVQGPPLRSNRLHFRHNQREQLAFISQTPKLGNEKITTGNSNRNKNLVTTNYSSNPNPQLTSSHPFNESSNQRHSEMSIGAKYSAAKSRVRKRLCQFQSQMLNAGTHDPLNKDVQTEHPPDSMEHSGKYVEIHAQTDDNNDHKHADISSKPIHEVKMSDETPMVDIATQIYPLDSELFSFDEEVALLLEALVCRTMENSILEILEEDNTDQGVQYTYYLTI